LSGGLFLGRLFTIQDGWVWFFGVIDHWNAECVGWQVAKKGNRFIIRSSRDSPLRRNKKLPQVAFSINS
ncbi:MAG: hypothetical protein KDK65_01710, partial [Chlamydiia bacterium]|nr:hypothetical protein [Chlamydiia bacterium]